MKNALQYFSFTLVLFLLVACGGGGEKDKPATPAAKTTATLKITLTGTLPASTTISGALFSLTLPANVTPAMNGAIVANSVVSNSGTFANSTLVPQVVYTAATSKLDVVLSNSDASGVTQVDEVATITLQLANSATPNAASFPVSAASVIDAALYNSIAGMGVSVASVTLQ
jgi:hypothetical protein